MQQQVHALVKRQIAGEDDPSHPIGRECIAATLEEIPLHAVVRDRDAVVIHDTLLYQALPDVRGHRHHMIGAAGEVPVERASYPALRLAETSQVVIVEFGLKQDV